jgi:hypothetical protein
MSRTRIIGTVIGIAAGLCLGGCGASTSGSGIDAPTTANSGGGSPGGNGGTATGATGGTATGGNGGAATGGVGGAGGSSVAQAGAGGSAQPVIDANRDLAGSLGGIVGPGGTTHTGGVGSGGTTSTGGVGSGGTTSTGGVGSGGITNTGGVGPGGRPGSGGILGAGGEPPPVGNCDHFSPSSNLTWYRCAASKLNCPLGEMSCCGQTVYRYLCVCENYSYAGCKDNGPCPPCIDSGIDSSPLDGPDGSGG